MVSKGYKTTTEACMKITTKKNFPLPGADPVPWMSIRQKAIYKVTLVLTDSSDTSSGIGGRIEVFSNDSSCETDRFDFKPGQCFGVSIRK